MEKIIIYGIGAVSRVLYFDIMRYKSVSIEAFCVDKAYLKETSLYGIPVVPFEDLKELYPMDEYKLISIGSDTKNKIALYNKAKEAGYSLANYISPGAILDDMPEMGDNNIIMANAVVGFGGKMGSNNTIRQNVYLGHEFKMGDHNTLTASVTLGGLSVIGDANYFGLNSTGRDKNTYGDYNIIGMGAVVVKSIGSKMIVGGNPAKLIKENDNI